MQTSVLVVGAGPVGLTLALDLARRGVSVRVIVRCRLRAPGGEREESFEWLAGCDGAHSTTRHALGIPFEGEPYGGEFLLADADVDAAFANGAIRTFLNTRGTAVFFPLALPRHRLFVIRREPPVADAPLDEQIFGALLQDIVGQAVKLHSFHWLTRFTSHHRLAASWRKGRAFLAGDAAHIHSPAGGQGMNMGMQDALVLGHMLTKAAAGRFVDLDDYERERMPVARAVLRGTDFLIRRALGAESVWTKAARRYALPALLRFPPLHARGVRAMFQIDQASRVIELRRS